MIFGILLVIFLLVCIFLCLLVLIQSDKGGGLSGSIGGLSGASNFLGTQDTANVLTKGTYIFGGVFLLLCVLMTFFAPGSQGVANNKSALQKRAEQAAAVIPGTGFGAAVEEDAPAIPGLVEEENAVISDESAATESE